MSNTTVVNVKTDKYDFFCGRPSIYGNPFIIGVHGDREKCIKKFKSYFNLKIKLDPSFKKEIFKLKGKRIACYCSPLSCHLDVIKEYLDNIHE